MRNFENKIDRLIINMDKTAFELGQRFVACLRYGIAGIGDIYKIIEQAERNARYSAATKRGVALALFVTGVSIL